MGEAVPREPKIKIDHRLVGRKFMCEGIAKSSGLFQRLRGLGLQPKSCFRVWAVNPWLKLVILQLETQLVGLRYDEFQQLKLNNREDDHE